MIIKIERYNKNSTELDTMELDTELIFNVERVATMLDEATENLLLIVSIKGQEKEEYIPLTYTDEGNNHIAIASAVWVMNEEGKTIERLV